MFLGLPSESRGQEPAPLPGEIAGRVRDAQGVPVFAALVTAEPEGGGGRRAAETDRLGFFRIEGLPPGLWQLVLTRLGYEEAGRTVRVRSAETVMLELRLEESAVAVEGVSVEAERSRERIRFEEVAGATVREMSLDEFRAVPGVGEVDPIRAVGVLPGVISTSDLSSNFNVRGGAADQNLVLLDGVPVFSPFHLGGFFSVFNADMVDRVELLSGGFPARFGGRVSSVLTVDSDPGEGETAVDAAFSLLTARAAVSGGLGEGALDALGLSTARWRVSARRSWFDLLLAPVFEFPYHLTDLQLAGELWTKGGDRVSVTAYTGDDVLDLTRLDIEDFPLRIDWGWGNDLAGVSWTHPFRGGGAVEVRGSATRFGTGLSFPDFDDTEFRSRLDQASLAADVRLAAREGRRLSLGVSADRFSYDNLARTGGTVFAEGLGTGRLLGGWIQGELGRSGRWLVELGLRADTWLSDPGGTAFELSPRVAVKRFFAGSRGAVKVAAGRYTQFLHSVRDEELPLGLDVWVLAGERAPHVVSDQIQAGVEAFPGDGWNVSLEGYWREFDGVVALNTADDPNDDLDDLVVGRGTSYGADLLLKRDRGEVTGWLSLSWLKASRTFPDLLSPLEPRPAVSYPPIFDRRLEADLVLRFPAPGGWTGSLRWNVGTGLPYTRPLGSFAIYSPDFPSDGGRFFWQGANPRTDDFGAFAVALGDRNGARYPAYHRLDVGFRKTFEKSWGALTPHVDVLNVYNRRNVLFYFFEYDRDPPTRSGISMFPVLPTVGLEVTF